MIKDKMIPVYMKCAESFASLSSAKRLKVGSVAITPDDVMLYSWNGTASGDDNGCEDKLYWHQDGSGFHQGQYEEYYFCMNGIIDIENYYPFEDKLGRYRLITKSTTLHSERNIIAKAAKEGVSLKGATVVVTSSPCLECSIQLYQAGVTQVIYKDEYRDTSGLKYLSEHGVSIKKFNQ